MRAFEKKISNSVLIKINRIINNKNRQKITKTKKSMLEDILSINMYFDSIVYITVIYI